jgi:hypothetical protein
MPFAFHKAVAGGALNAAVGASVAIKVRNADGTNGANATVYGSPTGGTVANPLTADGAGEIVAWVDPGVYNVVATLNALTTTRAWDATAGDALSTGGASRITNTTSSHALQILNNTTNDSSCEALDIVSANEADTTVGIKGVEAGRGTIKVTHMKPPSGADDTNASALSIRVNGVGTAAQGIFLDTEDTPTTGKLVNFRQKGVERFTIGPDGDITVGGNNLNDFFLKRRASDVATMPDILAQNAFSLTAANLYGAIAYAIKAGTYTKLRICTGGTAPAGLTDLRTCVWASNGTLLQSSANVSATVTATNTMYEIALGASVALTEQQAVYLGVAWTGTTLNLRGAAQVSSLTALRGNRTFPTAIATSGYASGVPGNLNLANATGSVLWAELAA